MKWVEAVLSDLLRRFRRIMYRIEQEPPNEHTNHRTLHVRALRASTLGMQPDRFLSYHAEAGSSRRLQTGEPICLLELRYSLLSGTLPTRARTNSAI